jgi:hypothetical protein
MRNQPQRVWDGGHRPRLQQNPNPKRSGLIRVNPAKSFFINHVLMPKMRSHGWNTDETRIKITKRTHRRKSHRSPITCDRYSPPGGTSYTSPYLFKRIMSAIFRGISLGDQLVFRAETIGDSCNSSLQLCETNPFRSSFPSAQHPVAQ